MAKKVVAFIDFPKFGINRCGKKRPLVTPNRDNKKKPVQQVTCILGIGQRRRANIGEGE